MKKTVLSLISVMLILAVCASGLVAKASFSDVTAKQWFFDAVSYCESNGYMNGVGRGQFQPSGVVTRSQVAQVLYNKAGAPDVSNNENPFSDVKKGTWYYNAVVWARSIGVVKGTSASSFSPTANVTREQVCTMFMNYYEIMFDLSSQLASDSELAKYTDANAVSKYAIDPVKWAIKTGFMKGTSATTLAPKNTCIRAQLAQFLMNFDSLPGVLPPAITELNFEKEYLYIAEGETINITIATPGIDPRKLSWEIIGGYGFSVDNQGNVSLKDGSGEACGIVTAKTSNGLSDSCRIMVRSKTGSLAVTNNGKNFVYRMFPEILSFENISPETPLWQDYSIVYEQFGIYDHDYVYLINSLEEAQKLAEMYARWLETKGYQMTKVKDVELGSGYANVGVPIPQEYHGRYVKSYELQDPTGLYSITVIGDIPAIGGDVECYEVEVSIDYENAIKAGHHIS